MFDLEIGFITGLSFGIEFPPVHELNEDITFCMAIDLGIIRIMLLRWEQA